MRLQPLALVAMGELLNLTAEYMSAESNTPDEGLAEGALMGVLEELSDGPGEVVAMVLTGFTVLVMDVADPGEVQQWFDKMAGRLKP